MPEAAVSALSLWLLIQRDAGFRVEEAGYTDTQNMPQRSTAQKEASPTCCPTPVTGFIADHGNSCRTQSLSTKATLCSGRDLDTTVQISMNHHFAP